MSVYEKEKPEYLDSSLESINKQTLLPDEIVLVEDGPLTNELYKIIQKWKKETEILKSVKLKKNSGLAKALNIGLKHCKNNIVARMDSDDICLDDRFQKQIDVLQNDSSIVLLGGQVAEYDESMKKLIGYRKVPLSQKNIIRFCKKRSPFNHPTVVYKKDVVFSVGGYPEHLKKWQDYVLWSKIITKNYKVQNIQETVVKMRTGESLFERRSGWKYMKYEMQAYNYIYKSGLINIYEYVILSIPKIIIRLLPVMILKMIYRIFLRKNK